MRALVRLPCLRVATCFGSHQDCNTDSHASVQVFLWYRSREESSWKEKCESSPSTLNGAMRDDGWWQYTLQRKMRFLSAGPPPLVLGPPLTAVCTTGPWLENLRRLRDPTTPPSPNWELSPWAASTIEPLCWASDQEPRESIGKL